MSAALALRAVVAIALGVHRAVLWVQSHDPTSPLRLPRDLLDLIHDPTASDEEVAAALSEWSGSLADVATYNAPFELRKMQVIFTRASGAVAGDDVAVFTTHHLKLAADVPQDNWIAADFQVCVNAIATWFSATAAWFPPSTELKRIKFYKDGPAINPPQVAVYDTGDLSGNLGGGGSALPPQVALSVTERAGSKLHWGRIYLPAPAVTGAAGASSLTANGRPSSGLLTAHANALDTFYETCRTNNVPVVVYRKPLPERENAAGATLPARAGSAWTVETIAIDDVYDVMRSRRWKEPTVRHLRGIGA